MNISKLSELELIERLRTIIEGESPAGTDGLPLGIGDDTAVVSPPAAGNELFTIDTMVEGVHFIENTLTPRQLGRRCISVALSDIAAMGGDPAWALVACGLDPAKWSDDRAMELFTGMKERLDEFQAALVGGNLTRS